MLNKKNISLIFLIIILGLFTIIFVFGNRNTNDKSKEVAKNNEEIIPKNLEDLSIKQLTEIRNRAIDKNLEGLREFGEESIKERKDSILNFEFGLVAFVNKNYSNLTEKEKLIRQINIVNYENSINEIMDPSGSFFKLSNQSYQVNEFMLRSGKTYRIWSYEGLNFLIDHLEELCKFVDFDVKDVIEIIDPSIKTDLSEEQKKSLIDKIKTMYSSDAISEKIKKGIKNWENNLIIS
ncbi:hypothetical protein BGT96_14275 [Clostridioides difficile]|uniref:hypothetical protein n=1 Tax=Clostridioides difficile TaxID=1496 RepID=UPI000BB17124|nr:hypothetical protein [Clostridioides difficile]EGT4530321.1 hypothetical protein [Clostridioides difficile]EGT4708077.1 hypothetical protein [Clostridioides difficile]EGT4835383.1 hypothetical protein [Clostridioides difficile]EGT4911624.1 hypothetical protein [Clostridioides difficile]EGT5503519.1 hypothetical protein [Clostridioides difficile]